MGFKLEYERIEDKFAFLSLGEAQLMIEEVNGHWTTGELVYPFGRGINFQISVCNVNKISQSLKDNNIKIFKDIFESKYRCNNITYTEKELLVQDIDGYLLRFSEVIKEKQ